MNHKNTCIFIMSRIIYDATSGDDRPINSHLDLIAKREGAAGLADLADYLAGIVVDTTTAEDDTAELYDKCAKTLADHLAKITQEDTNNRVAIVSEKNKHLADNKKVYCFPLWCIQMDYPEATENTCLIVDINDILPKMQKI